MVRLLPKDKKSRKPRIMTEKEWRGVGVQQSRGWVHYAVHRFVLFLRTDDVAKFALGDWLIDGLVDGF